MQLIQGRVRKLGDNVDTDQIAPYPFPESWPETRAQMFPANPGFAEQFSEGDILVAGNNWGCGSSREQAANNIRSLGASAVLADSFARLFFRNGIAIGIPCVPCQGISKLCSDGDLLEIDLVAGTVRNVTVGTTLQFPVYPETMRKIIARGGLLKSLLEGCPAPARSNAVVDLEPGQTMVEKILARASGQARVTPGEFVVANVDRAILIEFIVSCEQKLQEVGITKFWDPDKVSSISTLRFPAPDIQVAETHKCMREIGLKKGISRHYGYDGIVNQVMVEKGDVLPGQLVFGTDSHSTSYGAVGAAGTGLGVSDMSYVLATGQLWLQVPETIRFNLYGDLGQSVMSKDIILYLLGLYGTDFARYKAIEFCGSLIDKMSISSRLTMSNMGVEMGAKFAMCPADEKTIEYLRSRCKEDLNPFSADEKANYAYMADIDISDIVPQVAKPHSPDNAVPVSALNDVSVDQVFLGSCTNARLEDLRIAAQILRGKSVAPSTRLMVTPASKQILLDATKMGFVETLLEAGAFITPAGCGACPGGSNGVLAPGETCLSTSNRNFRGRMGSPDASIYLSSPATAAASAITGHITDPREFWPDSDLA